MSQSTKSASRKSSVKSASRRISSSFSRLSGGRMQTRMYAAILFLIVIIFYNSFYGTMKKKPIIRHPRHPRHPKRREPFTKNFREKMRPKRRAVNNVQEALRNIFLF